MLKKQSETCVLMNPIVKVNWKLISAKYDPTSKDKYKITIIVKSPSPVSCH